MHLHNKTKKKYRMYTDNNVHTCTCVAFPSCVFICSNWFLSCIQQRANSVFSDQETWTIDHVIWMQDDKASECLLCHTKFTTFKRKVGFARLTCMVLFILNKGTLHYYGDFFLEIKSVLEHFGSIKVRGCPFV